MRLEINKIRNSDYDEQAERSDMNYKEGWLQCPICGKQAEVEKNFNAGRKLHLIDGGGTICDEETEQDCTGSDVGWWPVGTTCWKKWMKAIKEAKNGDEG